MGTAPLLVHSIVQDKLQRIVLGAMLLLHNNDAIYLAAPYDEKWHCAIYHK